MEKLLDFVGSIFHLFAWAMCQDWYFFTDHSENCTLQDFGLTRSWIRLEIYAFYCTILSSMVFLLISKFALKKTGLMYLENEETDFLTKYCTMNFFY